MIQKISLTLLTITMILIASCGEEQSGSSVSIQDQQALLANIGDNIIVPSYQNLDSKVADLLAEMENFKSDLSSENFAVLKTSLKEARLAWQWCNFYDFGPASEIGLASTINTFPVDKDAIERNIAGDDFNLESVAAADERGFAAIGYLLHGAGESDAEILQQFVDVQTRVDYLDQLIRQVTESVNSVYQRWDSDQDNYIETFKTATGTNVGSSLSLLTNALTQSFERKTRDGKIGIPVGLRTLGVPVPNSVEALYAGYSVDLVQENLKAYQNLFLGTSLREASSGNGDSYLTYLELLENMSLSNEIKERFEKSVSAVNLLNEPYQEEVQNNPNPSNTVIAEIQQLIVLIKSEMASTIGISITFQDNDGD